MSRPNLPHHPLPPGTVLEGRFEIEDILGMGGFATVYKARQLNIGRSVAIKILEIRPDDDLQEMAESKFLQEAQAIASISHPNVVTVFDYGIIESTGRPFIVMEMLDGYSLKQSLRHDGPMSVARASKLFLPCLQALADVHKKGIVHRDLKPANLFLTDADTELERMTLLDFGIARVRAAHERSRTADGQIIGTPLYLSPEYIEERIALPALDVYQIALVFIESLTGSPVVDGNDPYQNFFVHTEGKLKIPVNLLASPLGPVLRKALELNYKKRYQNGSQFYKAMSKVNFDKVPVPCEHKVELGFDTDSIAVAPDSNPFMETATKLEIPRPIMERSEPEPDPPSEDAPEEPTVELGLGEIGDVLANIKAPSGVDTFDEKPLPPSLDVYESLDEADTIRPDVQKPSATGLDFPEPELPEIPELPKLESARIDLTAKTPSLVAALGHSGPETILDADVASWDSLVDDDPWAEERPAGLGAEAIERARRRLPPEAPSEALPSPSPLIVATNRPSRKSRRSRERHNPLVVVLAVVAAILGTGGLVAILVVALSALM